MRLDVPAFLPHLYPLPLGEEVAFQSARPTTLRAPILAFHFSFFDKGSLKLL